MCFLIVSQNPIHVHASGSFRKVEVVEGDRRSKCSTYGQALPGRRNHTNAPRTREPCLNWNLNFVSSHFTLPPFFLFLKQSRRNQIRENTYWKRKIVPIRSERYFQASHSERIQRATRCEWRVLHELTNWFVGDRVYRPNCKQLPVFFCLCPMFYKSSAKRSF